MKQLIYIHGWDCYRNEEDFCNALKNREWYEPFKEKIKWKVRLREKLRNEYEIAYPDMPNLYNARYKEWKIWFEKILPFLNDEKLVIIGHSLWCIFLSKYLSENKFPKRISQLHFVAWVFDEEWLPEWEDYLADFVFDPSVLKNLEQQVDKIFLYHSKDDTTVPYSHVEKFKSYLPNAILTTFDDRWHFSIPEFPELLEEINTD